MGDSIEMFWVGLASLKGDLAELFPPTNPPISDEDPSDGCEGIIWRRAAFLTGNISPLGWLFIKELFAILTNAASKDTTSRPDHVQINDIFKGENTKKQVC